jgi:hypothetical protein
VKVKLAADAARDVTVKALRAATKAVIGRIALGQRSEPGKRTWAPGFIDEKLMRPILHDANTAESGRGSCKSAPRA